MKKIGVALFVYKRPELTAKTIEHLKRSIKNSHVNKLYVFQDGLKNIEDSEDWNKVNSLIKEIDFIDKELIVSDVNKGLANSIVYGINHVLKENDRIITIEDDCVVAKDYFKFMEECFDKYEENERVMCISGYSWPIDIDKDYPWDVYFSYRMSSLGWGTWKNRWNKYVRDFNVLREILNDEKKREIFKICGDDFKHIIVGQLFGKSDSWTVFWQLIQNNNFGVCVQPVKSLAQDIGRDGSGTNTVVATDIYDVVVYDSDINALRLPSQIIKDNDIDKKIVGFFEEIPYQVKMQCYYKLLSKWVENLNRGLSLKSYAQNITSKVCIYGCGNLGKLILDELSKYISVHAFIDANSSVDNFNNIQVINAKEYEKYMDCLVIVTPVYDYANIKTRLHKYSDTIKVISLEDLIEKEMK